MAVPTLAAILATAFAAGASTPTVTGDLLHSGRVTIDLGANESARALSVQGDGKLLVAGSSSRAALQGSRWALARLDADGRLDPGFGRGGVAAHAWNAAYGDAIYGITVTADRRIVVAGTLGEALGVERLLEDGSPDPTFGGGDGLTVVDHVDHAAPGCLTPSGVVARDDGTIAVAASAGCGGEDSDIAPAIVLLDAGGTVHRAGTFSWAADRCGFTSGIVLQADGRIVVGGGDGGCYEDRTRFRAARFDRDGRFDPGFGRRGLVSGPFAGPYSYAADIALDSTGRILLAGIAPRGAVGVVRLRSDGSLAQQTTVAARRWRVSGGLASATAIAVSADDGVVFAGDLTPTHARRLRLAAARLEPSGAVAAVWREPASACTMNANDLAVDAAGAALIAATSGCGEASDLVLIRAPL